MPRSVLDSGAVTWLAESSKRTAAVVIGLRRRGLWPPLIPSAVLIECLTGDNRRDVAVNRLIRTCDIAAELPRALARRSAILRTAARRGSAVDALLVATAEPGGLVLTGDPDDLRPLAASAINVTVRAI